MKKPHPSIRAFAAVIKELRIEREWTQEKLAGLALMNDRNHVSVLESGTSIPMLPTIFNLADAFDMPASELLALVEKRLA